MSEIKYGNGSYRIASILRQSREEFVNTNKTYLQGKDEVKRKAQLGELWDAAKAAQPTEPAKPAASPKGKGNKNEGPTDKVSEADKL